jgi:hypothetical protein
VQNAVPDDDQSPKGCTSAQAMNSAGRPNIQFMENDKKNGNCNTVISKA